MEQRNLKDSVVIYQINQMDIDGSIYTDINSYKHYVQKRIDGVLEEFIDVETLTVHDEIDDMMLKDIIFVFSVFDEKEGKELPPRVEHYYMKRALSFVTSADGEYDENTTCVTYRFFIIPNVENPKQRMIEINNEDDDPLTDNNKKLN